MLIKKNALSILKIVFPIAVLLFVIYQSKKELTNLSFKRTLMVINGLERTDLFMLVLIGLLAVAAMSLYDYVLKILTAPIDHKRKSIQGFLDRQFI